MSDEDRTREELVSELRRLRRRVAALEGSMHKGRAGTPPAGDVETQAADDGALVVDSEAFRRMFTPTGSPVSRITSRTTMLMQAIVWAGTSSG